MKNIFKKFTSLSSETKAGVVLALGAAIIFVSAFALSNAENNSEKVSSISSTSQVVSTSENQTSTDTSFTPIVDVMMEEIIRPYNGNLEVLHYFYEKNDPVETRVKSIIKVPGETSTYVKSLGNDYVTKDQSSFDVIASLSGTVVDKINDSTYGTIIVIEHKSGIKMVYASLGDTYFNKGDEVNQGDKIATSGTSLYLNEVKSGLHFEIIKDGKNINPEKSYSKSYKEL